MISISYILILFFVHITSIRNHILNYLIETHSRKTLLYHGLNIFAHADIIHLSCSAISLFGLMGYERDIGTGMFREKITLVIIFIILIDIILSNITIKKDKILGLSVMKYNIIRNIVSKLEIMMSKYHNTETIHIGFSGVIFGMLVFTDSFYRILFDLCVSSLIFKNVSLYGHIIGIISGIMVYNIYHKNYFGII